MLNPYALLAALLAFLAVAFGGYRYGYSRAEDAVAARVAVAQNEAITAANERTKAEVARTLESAKREADARVRAASVRRTGEIDASAKARPECDRDATSMRLLAESIAEANGATTAGNSLPDPVPTTPATDQR